MGTYNILKTHVKCPRCNQILEQEIELFFGYTSESKTFKIGDKYLWSLRKQVQNGGRPENGNLDGEGYTECSCGKDFFVNVIVRDDVLVSVKVNPNRKPYITD